MPVLPSKPYVGLRVRFLYDDGMFEGSVTRVVFDGEAVWVANPDLGETLVASADLYVD